MGALKSSSKSLPTLESLVEDDNALLEETKGGNMIRFRGSFEHNLDKKGRVSIPSSFRGLLQGSRVDSLVLTNYICDGAKCLEAFPLPVWEVLEQKLLKLSRFNPRLKSLENYYFSRASLCSLDSSGRIIIPSVLRDYAGMKSEISFTAGLRGFRLWDARVWQHIFSQAETNLLENPELFLDLDL